MSGDKEKTTPPAPLGKTHGSRVDGSGNTIPPVDPDDIEGVLAEIDRERQRVNEAYQLAQEE